jgi:uncharacterized protein
MNSNIDFELKKYNFNKSDIKELEINTWVKNYWPMIYILSCGKKKLAYIGETTDALARMSTHLNHDAKNKLSSLHLITSYKFNKSATLDIESNLIKYISADGEFNLLNGNLGLSDHIYYQKRELYDEIFRKVWDKLRSEGIAKHSLQYIDNSDVFKYSPYKSLSYDQRQGLLTIMQALVDTQTSRLLVEGCAGTGKSILAIFLFKLLNTDPQNFNFQDFGVDEMQFVDLLKKIKEKYPNPKMGLVVPVTSFRSTLKKVFKNISGLSPKMIIGANDVTKEKYDILVIDESHHLKKRVNLSGFKAFDDAAKRINLEPTQTDEMEWALKQSTKVIFFYDPKQSIRPSDVDKSRFDALRNSFTTKVISLVSQFRVRGGASYIDFIGNLLECKLPAQKRFSSKTYEFLMFEKFKDFQEKIMRRDDEHGLSRMASGFAWKWNSKGKKGIHDIEIEGIKLKWNGVTEDWINSENSAKEVGCIHTTQGYDLNYAGIIFSPEIDYSKKDNAIVVNKNKYFDKNGKNSINDPQELKEYVLNIYKTMMLRGIKGTFIYVCNENLREYFAKHIPLYRNQSIPGPLETYSQQEIIPFKNSVPLYDLKVAAGSFSKDQNATHKTWIKVPDKITEDYFACKVIGDSMNQIIPNGSTCLFKRDTGGSRNGKIVLVEQHNSHDEETGSCYTVKEYHSRKTEDESGWSHTQIILSPKSTDNKYKSIVLDEDSESTYRVAGIFVRVLT